MSSAALVVAAAALVLLGLGLLLLASAKARAREEGARAFLQAQTEQVKARYATTPEPQAGKKQHDWRRKWADFLRRADLAPTRHTYALWGALLAAMVLAAATVGGGLAAVAGLVMGLVVLYFLLWHRARRLGTRLRQQLPSFLDAVVRMMSIGSSVPAAFQTAIGNTEAPLRQCLVQAIHLQRAGKELDQAVLQVARIYRVDELMLLSSVLRLAVRYGGRADIVMERTAAFMRDREQAQQELRALSSETRLSAWILGLLPLVVGGMMFIMNAAYIMMMWRDPTGKTLLLVAVMLELMGAAMLYRLAKSV
ncbi:type II secretion system F family protein [Cupriavidus sp. CV2]|uniref:type II secretion system F family protein n=1 Tax=Cupriavidus ulmosensis TaxID=3065913 RepID=UPI00296B0CD4|nr:type II secretion system F family protein [Cupriavidus sp. CV2]MDW3684082.1 type II secretion system F family protein [Cupriavidus sp. CV2]